MTLTLGQHQEEFSDDIVKLLVFAKERGYRTRLGEGQRTVEQQQIYVNTGRSKTMNSQHLKKLAEDLHFTKDGVLCYPEELGHYWESLNPLNHAGMFWPSFKDDPHFERTA